MSDKTGSDVNSQEQAVRQKQSENLGWSSSFLKNPSTSSDSRSKNVHFQVLLQENSDEEFILMDDWLCIDSSSSEDDEPSNHGEIMPALEKETTRINVPNSGQVQTSPVLNFALKKTTYVKEENIMADNIPNVDVKRETLNKASTYSAVSEKGRAESYFILDASEGLRGNSDNEYISSDKIEAVDMIESMPNCSLSCSDSITHKVSGRETTFFAPHNVVISDLSGSSAPKNLSKTESFSILPRQTSPSKPICVTIPELKFDRSVATSVHENSLRTECASVKKNSVGSELSDKSNTEISRAAIKDEAFCNMASNYGDHSETEDVIIISDDDIVREPQNLKETSDSSFLCMKNLSVSASQFSRELPLSRLSKGRSATTTTDKISTSNKMLSNTATNEMSSKATSNNISPFHASGTVIPLWVPTNDRSPVNAQVHPSFSPVKAQVHLSSSSPVKAHVHSSSSSLVTALVHSSLSPIKAQDHSSFSLTATKIPVQLQSTSDHSEVIPTTKFRVQENLKTEAVDIWNIPKGDYKGREVDFVNNDDGFSPLSSTGGKTVHSAKCAILSSTGDRTTNLNKNEISSQQQTMKVEPSKNISSKLVTSRMMETTLENHLYKTTKRKSHKGTELNISSSLDPTLKIHQAAAAVYKNFHSCQGSRKGYFKASECTPQLKKMKMTPGSNVTRSSIVPSLPSPDATVPDSTLCRYKKCPSSPEPLIPVQKSITEATRVIGHNKTIDAHKQSRNSFVIKSLEVISKVINTLGSLGSAVEHLLVQSTLVVAEGKDPLELFLVKDNVMVLDLISQKLSSQIEGKLLPSDLTDSSEEALKMIDQLLEAASQIKSKEKFLGLDIGAIARATNGNSACQIIAFVKKMLRYQGKKETKEDLHNIFMAVTSMHCKLQTESMINNPLNFVSSGKHDLAAKSSEIPDDSFHLLKMGLSEPLETLNSSLSPEEKTHKNRPNVHGKCTAREKC